MKARVITTFLMICICVGSVSAQGIFSLFGAGASKSKLRVKFVDGDEKAKDEILLISIKGIIQEKEEQGSNPFKAEKDLFENLKKDLDVARQRKAIKAILLEINSPGGEVTASDIMYHQINKLRHETKLPVVALIGSMGASGAYYVACAADKIMAHPTSIIGSIGVLMQSINVQQLAEKVGFKAISLKSDKTPMKDVLSPFKEMTAEEKTMLLGIIESIYDRFVEIVADSRKLTKEEVIKIADGGIYTSKKAKELDLIDAIGYREDAMAKACELADIESAALVKRVSKKGFGEILAEMSEANSALPSISAEIRKLLLTESSVNFMFK